MEYLLVAGVVGSFLILMRPFLMRSVQATIKMASDQVGIQQCAEQQIDETSGYIEESYSAVRYTQGKQLLQSPGGAIDYIYGDSSEEESSSIVNMGLTNRTY